MLNPLASSRLLLVTLLSAYAPFAMAENRQFGIGNAQGNNNTIINNIYKNTPEESEKNPSPYIDQLNKLTKIRSGESIYIIDDRYQIHLIAANYLWGCSLKVDQGDKNLINGARKQVGDAFQFHLEEASFQLRVTKVNFSSCEFAIQDLRLNES